MIGKIGRQCGRPIEGRMHPADVVDPLRWLPASSAVCSCLVAQGAWTGDQEKPVQPAVARRRTADDGQAAPRRSHPGHRPFGSDEKSCIASKSPTTPVYVK